MFGLGKFLNTSSVRSIYSYGARRASTKKALDFSAIKNETKVPQRPVASAGEIKSESVTIDKSTLELLERLSLCNLSDK